MTHRCRTSCSVEHPLRLDRRDADRVGTGGQRLALHETRPRVGGPLHPVGSHRGDWLVERRLALLTRDLDERRGSLQEPELQRSVRRDVGRMPVDRRRAADRGLADAVDRIARDGGPEGLLLGARGPGAGARHRGSGRGWAGRSRGRRTIADRCGAGARHYASGNAETPPTVPRRPTRRARVHGQQARGEPARSCLPSAHARRAHLAQGATAPVSRSRDPGVACAVRGGIVRHA